MVQHFTTELFANEGIYSKHLNSANKVVHLARCATQDLCNADTSDMNNTQWRSLPSLSLWVFLVLWLDMYILTVSIESLPSQCRNTIQPQQMMHWTQCHITLSGALRHIFSKAPIFSIKSNVSWCPHNTLVHHAKEHTLRHQMKRVDSTCKAKTKTFVLSQAQEYETVHFPTMLDTQNTIALGVLFCKQIYVSACQSFVSVIVGSQYSSTTNDLNIAVTVMTWIHSLSVSVLKMTFHHCSLSTLNEDVYAE